MASAMPQAIRLSWVGLEVYERVVGVIIALGTFSMSRELLRPARRGEDLLCRGLARRARGFWVLLLVHPLLALAECPEKPSLWLDEPTAALHLLTKRDAELPRGKARLRGVQRVVLMVTVDREGMICQAKAVAGREDLADLAVAHVKRYWRYRPFLLDWKPAMAQFPVTLKFLPRKESWPGQRIVMWRGPAGLLMSSRTIRARMSLSC